MKEWGMCFLYNYPCILFIEWQWYKRTLDPEKAHSWHNPIFHFRHHHHCHPHQHTLVQKWPNPTLILGRKKLSQKLIFWEWSSFPSPLQRTGVIMIYEAAALLHSRLCNICKLWRKCRVLWRGGNSIWRVEKERGLTPKRRCLWNPVLATSHKQSSKLSYFANAFASKDFILEQFLSF